LASPIDQLNVQVPSLNLGLVLVEAGCTIFDPRLAWSNVDSQMEVQMVNQSAIDLCDGVLAYLPDGQASIGVPIEVGMASQIGKPVVVIGGEMALRSTVLRSLEVPVYENPASGVNVLVEMIHDTDYSYVGIETAAIEAEQLHLEMVPEQAHPGFDQPPTFPETQASEVSFVAEGNWTEPPPAAGVEYISAVLIEISRAAVLHPMSDSNQFEDWYGIWMEEVVEAAQAWNDWRREIIVRGDGADGAAMRESLREELVQVGAMAARLWESLQ
jgi:NTP pyrophosphatase (non-canonical NTP hydrolase)